MSSVLKNVTNGLAFVTTKDGLVPVQPNQCIAADKAQDIASLLETGIFVLEEETEKEEVKPVEEETEKEEVKPKKAQAPKCARKVNKPALD